MSVMRLKSKCGHVVFVDDWKFPKDEAGRADVEASMSELFGSNVCADCAVYEERRLRTAEIDSVIAHRTELAADFKRHAVAWERIADALERLVNK